jgi:hypothetical protein
MAPVARSPIDAELAQTLSQRLAVAKVPGSKPVDASCVNQWSKTSFPARLTNLDHVFYCNL